MSVRAVAVVGFKASGKTRVVEAIVRELRDRGYVVGTLKHTTEDVLLDTPGKDTWRHREAGAGATAILHESSAAFFFDRYLTVYEAASKLGGLDFVVLEGFKSLGTVAKIILPREAGEVERLSDGLEIACVDLVDGGFGSGVRVPVFSIDDIGGVVDIVEDRVFHLLPSLNCHGCGYSDCREMATAILAGDSDVDKCVVMGATGISLRVDGEEVLLGPFVQELIRNVITGLVKTFKGVEDPRRIELVMDSGDEDV
jgi:molybdopterin-guanine dinucleotide biosynthesis protein B